MLTAFKTYVTHVVDGDTFFGVPGGYVRLTGIDTPEQGQVGYHLAKQRLEGWILGREVQVLQVAVDDYGRVVADVYAGGYHVNAAMKRFGY
jgi:micrococcal nuclease